MSNTHDSVRTDFVYASPQSRRLAVVWQNGEPPDESEHSHIVCTRCGEHGHCRPDCLRYKTRLCAHHMRGSCKGGDLCPFAHSKAELRDPMTPRCMHTVQVPFVITRLVEQQRRRDRGKGADNNSVDKTTADSKAAAAAAECDVETIERYQKLTLAARDRVEDVLILGCGSRNHCFTTCPNTHALIRQLACG